MDVFLFGTETFRFDVLRAGLLPKARFNTDRADSNFIRDENNILIKKKDLLRRPHPFRPFLCVPSEDTMHESRNPHEVLDPNQRLTFGTRKYFFGSIFTIHQCSTSRSWRFLDHANEEIFALPYSISSVNSLSSPGLQQGFSPRPTDHPALPSPTHIVNTATAASQRSAQLALS